MPQEKPVSQSSEPSSQPAAGAGSLNEGWLRPLGAARQALEKEWKTEDFYMTLKKLASGEVKLTVWVAVQQQRRARRGVVQGRERVSLAKPTTQPLSLLGKFRRRAYVCGSWV